jgi:hypothetical protein
MRSENTHTGPVLDRNSRQELKIPLSLVSEGGFYKTLKTVNALVFRDARWLAKEDSEEK